VKNRYEPATFEQFVKVQLLFSAIFYDFAVNCTKLTLGHQHLSSTAIYTHLTNEATAEATIVINQLMDGLS
jgi:hypothetical protein